jgi:serine/threonine protein kinase
MSPSRWQQIEAIYHAALERAPDERAAYLDQACANDAELRREVESLLAQDLSKANPLDRPAWEGVKGVLSGAATVTVLVPGMQLGPYKIKGQLGKGRLGEVFRAVDARLGRAVAIKTSNEQFSERFEREARAISALNHPQRDVYMAMRLRYSFFVNFSNPFCASSVIRPITLKYIPVSTAFSNVWPSIW